MNWTLTIIATAALGIAGYWFWPSAARVMLTDDEINACAARVAIDDYRRDSSNNAPATVPFKRSEEDAIQSLIVDMGTQPNFIARSDAYRRSIGLDTVYTRYVEDGIKLCIAKKLRGEKIEWPDLKVKDGYHVTRSNGSAALVKDGDQEPIFGCIEGYHPAGNGCAR